ncbi:heme o synthase [Halobacteriales archaeon Cl-PHB]
MIPSRGRFGPSTLLTATAFGVYLLVVAGATADLANVVETCSSWPGCAGSLTDPTVLVALGHRFLAAVVGVLLLATGVVVARSGVRRATKLATLLALVLYPIQVGVGAVVAIDSGFAVFPGLHLLVGMSIFAAVVVALAWHLEATTGGDDDPIPRSDPATFEEPHGGDAPATPLAGRPLATRLKVRANAYFRLMKPRLMWLLCLVAAAGMALAAGPDLSVRTIVLTLGGGVLAIGASGTFNHVIERDRDKQMDRTNDRPVVTHEVPARRATVFGLLLAGLSLGVFWQVNVLAAALGLTAILFYSVVYTVVLKPNTVQNTVIGGAAGALPAVIGTAAVTGKIGLPGLLLAGLIFVWTPAHFYNLALAYKEDYAAGGYPMMPVVRGEATTRKHILGWLAATLAAAAALIWFTNLGWLAAAATTFVGGVFLWAVVRLHREQTEQAAFRAFHASNAYLGVVLLAVVVDSLAI